MSDPTPPYAEQVAAIHAAATPLVLEFAGAGSLALAWLHGQPGSSRTVLEATDRYSAASLADLLGTTPAQFTSVATACAMARAAYLRAARLAEGDRPFIGVACTATIATDRAKRGEHRACVAIHDAQGQTSHELVLTKGIRSRDQEEALVGGLLLSALSQALGLPAWPLPLNEGEAVSRARRPEVDSVARLLRGEVRSVLVNGDGSREADRPVTGIVYPGSFNPLHFGHQALAAAASRLRGEPVTFEISAEVADKGTLSRAEIERRLAQFQHGERIVLSRQRLFVDKAKLYPGCTFLMGYDTAARLIDPKYYGSGDGKSSAGSETRRDEAMDTLRADGCRILVAGRLIERTTTVGRDENAEATSTFATADDLPLPASAAGLIEALPATEFRADISATMLRESRNRRA